MKYCTYCGNLMIDEAVICLRCGCAAPRIAPNYRFTDAQLLSFLAERIKINGVIWLVIGILQIILGLYISHWTLIVGVLNIITAVNDLNRSSQILHNPRGIVNEHESMIGPIITLVYNILIGGLIGVVGSIYYFVAIRGMVMENKTQLLEMENRF